MQAATPSRPSILLITSDQQHWSALGSINPKISTPALDRLAAMGTRYDRAYCPNPLCSPSRSSIITGLYPSVHGCWTIGVKLAEDVPTVGQYLSAAGYDTTLVGKAHMQPQASTPDQTSIEYQPLLRDLDFWRNFHGPFYGFDHIEIARMHADEHLVGQHYAVWLEDKGLANWRDYFVEYPPNPDSTIREHLWDLPEAFHYSTWTAERTIAQLRQSVETNTPFFSWASFHDPHPPYLVPEPWTSMYDPADMEPGRLTPGELDAMPRHYRLTQETSPDFSEWRETPFANHGFSSHIVSDEQLRKDMAIYYGMTSFVDQQIGRILDSLDELGVTDNTIIVFTTDHGHFMGEHGLNKKGAFHYEDLIRLPFIVSVPGMANRGSTSDALLSLVDLAPTFLEAAGMTVPGLMQGVSQWDVWNGTTDHARDWAMVENRHQPAALNLRTLVTREHKITVYRGSVEGELFDLVTDPEERRNLWANADAAALRSTMLLRLAQAEIEREPTRYPRIASA